MRRAALAALAVLVAGWALTLWVAPWSNERVNDLFVYRTFAEPVLAGELPYRDVAFEYPPLAAPAIALPGLAGTGEEAFRWAFALWTLAAAAAVVLLCGALARATASPAAPRETGAAPRGMASPAAPPGAAPRAASPAARAMLAAALIPVACGALLRTHFDLFPVALLLAGLLLVCRERPRAGLAVLGLGAMTKLFPLVAVPVALVWLLARGRQRDAWQGALACAAVMAVVAGAALAISPSGAADAVAYHLDRPVQIESSPALVLLGLDAAGLGNAESVSSHRSDGLLHPAADAVASLFLTALFAFVALLCVTLAGGRRRTRGREGRGWEAAGASPGSRAAAEAGPGPRELVIAALAACAGFALFGKVLSPQFVIWVLPLGALAFAWRLHALAAAVALVAVLTQVEFPARYFDVVAREPLAIGLVGLRNLALLAVLVLSVRALQARREEDLLDSRGPALAVGLD